MPNNKNTRSPNGSGSVDKITVNEKEYWRGRVRLPDPDTGVSRTVTFTGKTQKEVLKKLRDAVKQSDEGGYRKPSDKTVEEWMKEWLDSIRGSVKILTQQTYESKVRTYIIPELGKIKLRELKPVRIQAFEKKLSEEKGLAPKSFINILAILQKALEEAVVNDYIQKNPALHVRKPRKKQLREMSPLTETELRNFLKVLHETDDVYARLCEVTVWTGMREGEICGLSWNDVDFKHGSITIRQQLQKPKNKGSEYIIESTKNDRERTIQVSDSILALLKRQKSIQSEWMEKLGADYRNKWNLVFTHEDGSNLSPQTVLKVYKRFVTKIGRPDARFHDLRHTFAVNAIQEGNSIKMVQAALGHATASFTLDVYGHVSEKMQKDLKNSMDDLMERVSG